MSERQIRGTIHDFAATAALAKAAGYDGVDVMGSEGYLINQFISERVGTDFIIIFRLSMLDLMEQGSTPEEVIGLGKAREAVGVTLINTGIGWHEARIPTIATSVPRGAFSWVTAELKKHLKVPLITTNRINTPEVSENRADEINTCIACNQACLDHVFKQKLASCLVNPCRPN